MNSNMENMENILDGSNQLIEIIDSETYELLFLNKKAREFYQCDTTYKNKKCYDILHNKTEKCESCNLGKKINQDRLLAFGDRMVQPCVWDGHNAIIIYENDQTVEKRLSGIYQNKMKENISRIGEKSDTIIHIDLTDGFVLDVYGNSTFTQRVYKNMQYSDVIHEVERSKILNIESEVIYEKLNRNYLLEEFENGKSQVCIECQYAIRANKVKGYELIIFFVLNLVNNHVECLAYGMDVEKDRKDTSLNQDIITSLCAGYLNVYLLEIDTHMVSIIKQENYSVQGFTDKENGYYPYEAMAKQFIEERVFDLDKEKMKSIMDYQNVIDHLKDSYEYVENYRTFIDNVFHYFQIKYTKLTTLNCVVVSFLNMDAVVENELKMQKSLSDTNIELQKHMDILNSVATVFNSIYHVDLATGYFYEIGTNIEKVRSIIGRTGDAQSKLIAMCNHLIMPESKEEALEFTNLETLPSRLKDKTYITFQFLGNQRGWSEGAFVVAKRDESGNPIQVLWTTRDINKQKMLEIQQREHILQQAKEVERQTKLHEKELLESIEREKKQQETIAQAVLGGFKIARNDKHYSIKYVSDKLAKMLGYTVEEFYEKCNGSMNTIILPQDLKVLEQKRINKNSRSNLYVERYHVLCKDGSYKYVEERGKLIETQEGEFEYWSILIDQDEIAEKEKALLEANKANKALEESKHQLEEYNSIIANAGFGIWYIFFVDGKKPRMRANKKMLEVLGIEEELSSEDIYDFWYSRIPESERPSVEASMATILSGKSDENTYMWIHPKLGERYVRSGGKAYVNERTVTILCGYHSDVTELVLEEKNRQNELNNNRKLLERALEEARAASNAKTVFLNNMSHDIRTPMNAIIGYSTLMEKELDNKAKLKEHLDKMKNSSEFLLSLINNVLGMARIESGKIELNIDRVDIKQCTLSLVSIFEHSIEEKNLKFNVDFDLVHSAVYGDEVKIREIYTNLLSNAIKYTRPGDSITGSIREEEIDSTSSRYIITLSDTGIGMSEEFIPHIFDSFSREKNTTDSKIVGTGLGMPIVKKLVDLMNGTIDVKSKLGEGTTFTITTIMKFATNEDIISENQQENNLDFTNKRVLLVEDNELNAEIAGAILADSGIIVEYAENGKECIDMVSTHDPKYYDAILMDIQMPVMDGYQAASMIRQLEDERNQIPILAMTANAFEEDKKKALAFGMNSHITKPIRTEILFHELSKVMKK